MVPVRRVVVDVLKPHEPPLVEFSRRLGTVDGVEAVDVAVIEIDRDVQNVRVIVEGEDLEYPRVEDSVEELGATVHSVDEVACGEYLVADRPTDQYDRPSWLR